MKIKICIVLYNESLKNSKVVQSLVKHKNDLEGICANIYLNGDCEKNCRTSEELFDIIDNNGENLYLLKNYQHCIQRAKEVESEWIIFFDQDTEITQEYLLALKSLHSLDSNCVASFPILKAQTKLVSPKTLFHGTLFPSKLLKPGVHKDIDFLGLNSGSAYRVSFLETISDIDEIFRLDFIDYVFSYSVFKSGQSFNVMDVVLDHDMAVLHNKALAQNRAESILAAEYLYYKTYRSKFAFCLYKVKILTKLLKSVASRNYLYSKSTLMKYLLKKN